MYMNAAPATYMIFFCSLHFWQRWRLILHLRCGIVKWIILIIREFNKMFSAVGAQGTMEWMGYDWMQPLCVFGVVSVAMPVFIVCVCVCVFACVQTCVLVKGGRAKWVLQCSRTAFLSSGNFPWGQRAGEGQQGEGGRTGERKGCWDGGRMQRGSERVCPRIMRNDTAVVGREAQSNDAHMHEHTYTHTHCWGGDRSRLQSTRRGPTHIQTHAHALSSIWSPNACALHCQHINVHIFISNALSCGRAFFKLSHCFCNEFIS